MHHFVTRKKIQAFSLLELFMYIGISALSVPYIFLFMQNLYHVSYASQKSFCDACALSCACDLLRRDIWQCTDNPEFFQDNVFRCTILSRSYEEVHYDVWWGGKEGRLLRYEGEYDFDNHCWKHKKISVIAYTIPSFSLEPVIKEKRVIGVTVTHTKQEDEKRIYTENFYSQNGLW